MKLKIVTSNFNLIGLQLFDFLCAFNQYKNKNLNYKLSLDIEIVDQILTFDDDTNYILFLNIHKQVFNVDLQLDKFQVILIDNSDEPTMVLSDEMLRILDNYENSFLVCNGNLSEDHYLYNRTLVGQFDTYKSLSYSMSPTYPQYFEFNSIKDHDRKGITYINGANRTYRNFFLELISEYPSINTVNNYPAVVETISFDPILSDDDKVFLEFLKTKYADTLFHESENRYYNNSITIGINKKFGTIPLGYFLIPEYLEYHCVCYPETSWVNDEITITEKSVKCFLYEVIPFPIAGVYSHKILNNLGFRTAHDLLPADLQFDHIKDHIKRYKVAASAVNWLNQNTQVFKTDTAKQIKLTNKKNLFEGSIINKEVNMLYNIIKRFCQ